MSKTKRIEHLTPAPSETLLHMLETLPDALFVVDDADTIVYANASAQDITGTPPEEFLGNSFWRCAPQLVSTALCQAVMEARQTQEPTEVEYRPRMTRTWLHVQLAPTVGGILLHFHEGRAPTLRQEPFPQGERLCIDDLDGLHTRIGILTPEGIVLDINAILLDDAQVQREEVIGKPLAEAPWWSSSPASQEQLRAAIARASTGETVRFEALVHPREGMDLPLEATITPHMDVDHHIEYLVIAGIDLTERKRAEADIHALIDAIPQLVWTGRPDGYVDSYNRRWRDYTGLTTEEAQGDGWMQCTHPEDRQRVLGVWQRAVQNGEPYETEQRLRHGTTGEYRWFLMQATPYTDAQGTVLKYVGTCTDIHDKKQIEDEIRVLVDAIPQFVWMLGPDGSSEYGNQRWCDYTDMTFEHYQGNGWLQAIHPDDYQHTLTLWRHALETGESFECEYRVRNGRTGGYRWFLARAMPVRDDAGQIVKWFGTCTDIEEQKRAEQQLKESWENLRVLAETVPQLVWTIQPDGSATYFNQRYYDYTGASPEQALGHGWSQFLHPDDAERTLALRRHLLETGEPYEIEYCLKEGNTGNYRWFLARAMPVRDETGQIVKWFGTSTDIHDKKQAEAELRVLIDAIPQFVWIAGPDGSITYNNQRLIDFLAMTHEQAEGAGWMAGVHPDDRQRVWEAWQTSIETGVPYEVEHRLQDGTSGAYRWFLVRGVPQRNAQGTILHWVGTCTDIEEQKQAEERIKESRENLRVLAETVPQLVWTARPDGLHEYVNQRWRDYTGLTLEQIQSNRWSHLQFIHPDDLESNRANFQQALDTGDMYEHEERLRKSQTGEYRWFLTRAMPMRDETGQIIKWFGTCTDIEEQKRTEEALRQSQERASVLMNSNIIGIFVGEGDQIVDANDTFLYMTGYTREDLRAGRMNWSHMTPPGYLARTFEAQQELDAQQSLTPYEKEYVCKDGSRLPVLVGAVLLAHHPFQAITFVLDNSARKELEQRKDDFISMASHELRNPLTALKLHTTLLHRQLTKQGLQASALSSMQTQINKLTRLVEDLLDVSKIQAGRLEYRQESVDLDALLREIVDTMQQTNPSHTILVRGTVQAILLGDRDRLGQVFTNLLSNAIKYAPGAETVEVDLSASEETVTIRIRDHGLGIPREQRDKIFDRFYRVTDPKQKAIPGLGMGLYIVAEIVKHQGGTITVESEPGKGSTFQVTLPRQRT